MTIDAVRAFLDAQDIGLGLGTPAQTGTLNRFDAVQEP